MSRLSRSSVHNALEHAGKIIREAAGNDAVTSRSDIRKKLNALPGVERRLVEALYRFIDQRDAVKGARITRTDVESAVDYIGHHLIDRYDLNHNGFSQSEIMQMSELGQSMVALAIYLKRAAVQSEIHSGAELEKKLKELSHGMTFTGFGSEGDDPLETVFLQTALKHLDAQALADALHFDTSTPTYALERVYPYDVELNFELIDILYYDTDNSGRRAGEIVRLMTANLHDIIVVIFGKDLESPPQHPTYWVGLAKDGTIVGLKSIVIWT